MKEDTEEEMYEIISEEEATKVYLDECQIAELVAQVATELNREYIGVTKPVVMIGLLNGCVPFMADLMRQCQFPLITRYIDVKSYSGTQQGDVVVEYFPKDLEEVSNASHVLLVDEIIDSGKTISFIKDLFNKLATDPTSVRSCCLLERESCPIIVDFRGQKVEDDLWLFGYGMDTPTDLNRDLSTIKVN